MLRFPSLSARFGLTWLDLCNRNERLAIDPITQGRICQWADSSELTVTRFFPAVGRRLLCRLFPDEISLAVPETAPAALSSAPDISVLIPIGGSDRLPQFRAVLASLLQSRDVKFEVIAVEQSYQPELAGKLPEFVRYFHARSKTPSMPFNKAWALNVAAKHSRGRVFAIHDADYIVGADYLSRCVQLCDRFEAVLPARFVMHLTQHATRAVIAANRFRARNQGCIPVGSVVQNNPTPVVVHRMTYWDIGAHDEGFFGWGGEDAEFLDRLRTKSFSAGGLVPLVHLWHAPAPKKASGDRNREYASSVLALSPTERIERLSGLELGGDEPCGHAFAVPTAAGHEY